MCPRTTSLSPVLIGGPLSVAQHMTSWTMMTHAAVPLVSGDCNKRIEKETSRLASSNFVLVFSTITHPPTPKKKDIVQAKPVSPHQQSRTTPINVIEPRKLPPSLRRR